MLTPHELNLMILDGGEKVKEKRKAGIVSAFYSAYFSRLEKLSGADLEQVLSEIDKPEDQKGMSDEQMFEVAKRISAAFGG